VNVADTSGTMIVRTPVPPELANGSFTGKTCPEVTVNAVAAPIVTPVPFRNVTVPVQEAAVPVVGFAAVLWRFT